MLRLGLTGGIGSGKSTVAGLLRELGAVVTDADRIARDVVAPGQPALAAIAARFGAGVLRPDGTLDRAALAAVVFPSPHQLQALEAITDPAIASAAARQRAQVPIDRVDVYDMPLLVERGLWVHEHLTLVVGASEAVRVDRLVRQRGLSEPDVRARIAAQASDAERRAAADLWVDNDGSPEATRDQVERLWAERLVPFEENLRRGVPARQPQRPVLSAPDPMWQAVGARVVARLGWALGGLAVRVDHVGSTSVSGLAARDVIDVQVGLRRVADAADPAFGGAMRRAGYVIEPPDATAHEGAVTRTYAGCDPGRVTLVRVAEAGSPSHDFALAFRDWLRASPAHRKAYAAEKARLAGIHNTVPAYRRAKEQWVDSAVGQALAWQRQAAEGG